MSSAGTIIVQITAQEADLRANLALAKADLAAFTGEVRTLSAEMVASGKTTDAAMNVSLRAATVNATTAASAVGTLETDLKKMNGTLGGVHGSTATATREFRALFDELSSGRTRQTPGTLAIIAQRVFGISGAALAATGIVIALAGSFALLEYNAIKAAEAVDKVKLAGDFAGGVQLTKTEIQDLINKMGELPEVSRTDAEAVVDSFVKMGVQGKPALEGLSEATLRYSQVMGDTAPEAAKKFVTILGQERSSVTELQKTFPGLSTALAENFIRVQKTGDQHQIAAALIQLVADRTRSATGDWADYSAGVTRLWSNFEIYLGSLQGVRTMEEGHQAVLKSNTKLWDEQTAAILRDAAALRGMPVDTSAQFAKDVESATRSTHGRMDQLHDDIKRFQTDLASTSATEAQKANFRSMIEDDQRELETLAKKGTESFSKLTGFKDIGAEQIAQARETISQINADDKLNATQREEQEQQVWASILATAKLNAAQRIEIQKAMNDSIAAANRAVAAEQKEIDRSNTNTELELARIGFQEKRDLLDQEVAAGRITTGEKLNQLKLLAQAEGDADLQALNDEEKTYAAGGAAFVEAENKKRVAVAQTAAEIEKINAEIAANDRKVAQEDAQSWRLASDEIVGAERGMIGDLFSGRVGLLGALENATSSFLQKELANDVAYYTKKAILSKEDFAADQSHEQGGLLVHVLTEGQKTAATTAGETSRLAEKESATAAASATEVASGSAQIMNDASKAAAGAYSAVAGIPWVGPILAPIAAGTAFAAVAAFDTLTSLDVGAWNLPRDMPAMLHEGESVVPKNFASGMRENGTFGGNGGGTTNNVNLHYAPTTNAPQHRTLGQLLTDDASTMRAWFQAQLRSGAIKVG